MNAQEILREAFIQVNADLDADVVKVNSEEADVRRMQSLLNSTGRDLVGRGDWRGLVKSADLGTPKSEGNAAPWLYALPDDFHRLVEDGAVVDLTNSRPVALFNSIGAWRAVLSATGIANAQDTCAALVGSQVQSSKNVNLQLTYVSDAWVARGSQEVGADSDTFNVPANCLLLGTVYRWLRTQEGEGFQDAAAEYESSIMAYFSASRNVKEEAAGGA